MVAKLVRSSRAWSLVVFAVLSLGVVLLISHWGNPRQAPQVQAQIPGGGGGGSGGPLFPAGLTPAMLTGSLSAMVCPCDHGEFCGSCEDGAVLGPPVSGGAPGTKGSSCDSCSSGGGTKGASFGGLSQPGTQPQRNVAGAMNDVSTQGNSLIDNLKLSYYHSADDLLALGPTSLGLRRYHRFQDISDVGSFGATAFSNFDLKLKLIDGSLRLFRLFDPQQRKPMWMATDSTEAQVTDLYGQPLELRDAQGQATSDWSSIVTARLTTDQQNVFEFEFFAGCTNPTGTKEGRVVSLKDRLGRGLTLTYKTWTAEELQESPERQWQIDTVSDGNGRTLTMQFAPQQVGGRWVISQVSSSSGETVSYGYANQLLSSVTLGDGSVSTFAYSRDVASQCSVVEFFDAAAQGRHRRKQVYLSDHLMVPSGNTTEFVASAFAENAQSVRMATGR